MTTPDSPPRIAAQLDVLELKRRLDSGEALRVVDVREAHELALARVDAFEHLPLSEIQTWWHDLDPAAEIVIMCHHGHRSEAVCRALAAEGFRAVHSLSGGIDAWAQRVDPAVARY